MNESHIYMWCGIYAGRAAPLALASMAARRFFSKSRRSWFANICYVSAYEIKTIRFPGALAQSDAAPGVPGGPGGLKGLGCFLRRRTGALWPRCLADSF